MRFILLTFLILMSLNVPAEVVCEEDMPEALKSVAAVAEAMTEPNCPNPVKIRNICMTVDDRTLNSSDPKYKYMYQKKILEASCVDTSKDNEQQISLKISKMWQELGDKLICNNLLFDVANGNIIKFAVSSKFDEFIEDVAKWKIDLNRVDETDQRTVLDYIQDNIKQNKGTEIEVKLKAYYKTLRDAGAKHKAEL